LDIHFKPSFQLQFLVFDTLFEGFTFDDDDDDDEGRRLVKRQIDTRDSLVCGTRDPRH